MSDVQRYHAMYWAHDGVARHSYRAEMVLADDFDAVVAERDAARQEAGDAASEWMRTYIREVRVMHGHDLAAAEARVRELEEAGDALAAAGEDFTEASFPTDLDRCEPYWTARAATARGVAAWRAVRDLGEETT